MMEHPLDLDCSRWRSILFVPALNDRYVTKACTSNADAIQLDLEDSILPADKEGARAALPAAASRLRDAGKAISVRVNQPLELAVADIRAAVAINAAAIMLPKVEGASHVRLIDEMVGRMEHECGQEVGRLRFIVVVETPGAYAKMREIFSASPRIRGAMLGGEDFSTACECEPSEDVLLHYKQEMVVAARAAGVNPLGTVGSIAGFADLNAYEQMVRRSKSMGFHGTTCIHPTQVDVINAVYRLDLTDIAHARRIVEAAQDAAEKGVGAFRLDGHMIDAPIIKRAQMALQRAASA